MSSSQNYRFVVAFVYYGIVMDVSDLGGNVFINFFISAATELPAYLLSMVLAKKTGRVIPLSLTFLVSGILLLLVITVPSCELEVTNKKT